MNAFSAALPWSLMSPASTITSTSNCSVIERITSHALGLRWMSETKSTRIVEGSGWYAGKVDVTSYSRDTLVTSLASWASYFWKSLTMLCASPTTVGRAGEQPGVLRLRRCCPGPRSRRRRRPPRERPPRDSPRRSPAPAGTAAGTPAARAAAPRGPLRATARSDQRDDAARQVAHDLLAEPVDGGRVAEDPPGVGRVDPGHLGGQPPRPVVAVDHAARRAAGSRPRCRRRRWAPPTAGSPAGRPRRPGCPPASRPSQQPISPMTTTSTTMPTPTPTAAGLTRAGGPSAR